MMFLPQPITKLGVFEAETVDVCTDYVCGCVS